MFLFTLHSNFKHDTGKWTTDLFGQRTIKLLDQSDENAKFIYLAFNAPHEPTDAPETIKKIIRRAYPTVPEVFPRNLGFQNSKNSSSHELSIWLQFITWISGFQEFFINQESLKGRPSSSSSPGCSFSNYFLPSS